MAKEKTQVVSNNPGMVMLMTFLTMFVINAIVIYFANMFFPDQVVLGTMSISHLWSVFLSAGTLAVILTFAMPFYTVWEQHVKRASTPTEWMVGYLVLNAVSLWLITRVAEIFGLGVASWMVIVVLAAILDVVQGMVMMAMTKAQT